MSDIHKQLFDHFANEHDLILLDSEIHDIINIVKGKAELSPSMRAHGYKPPCRLTARPASCICRYQCGDNIEGEAS